jgi:hypothetical protein
MPSCVMPPSSLQTGPDRQNLEGSPAIQVAHMCLIDDVGGAAGLTVP